RAARRSRRPGPPGRQSKWCASCDSLLRGDDEMRAPVLRVRRFVVARIEGELLAVAHGAQPVARDAERDEVRARGGGAAFAQRQIVLGGAALVAVSFDRDGPGAIALQHFRVL